MSSPFLSVDAPPPPSDNPNRYRDYGAEHYGEAELSLSLNVADHDQEIAEPGVGRGGAESGTKNGKDMKNRRSAVEDKEATRSGNLMKLRQTQQHHRRHHHHRHHHHSRSYSRHRHRRRPRSLSRDSFSLNSGSSSVIGYDSGETAALSVELPLAPLPPPPLPLAALPPPTTQSPPPPLSQNAQPPPSAAPSGGLIKSALQQLQLQPDTDEHEVRDSQPAGGRAKDKPADFDRHVLAANSGIGGGGGDETGYDTASSKGSDADEDGGS